MDCSACATPASRFVNREAACATTSRPAATSSGCRSGRAPTPPSCSASATRCWSEGLHDRAFLDRYTVGFEQFEPYLAAQRDGQPKDAGLGREDHRPGRRPHRRPGARHGGDAHHGRSAGRCSAPHHGEQPYWAPVTLAAMLGQIGLPGGGFGCGYGAVNGVGSGAPRRSRPDAAAGRTTRSRLHPGRAHHRHAAAPGRAVRLRRRRRYAIPTSGSSTGPAATRSTTTRTSTGCVRAWRSPRRWSSTSSSGRRRPSTPTSSCRPPPPSSATTSATPRASPTWSR